MHTDTPSAPRMVPAWRGILGWALFLAAIVLAATAPWPYNGQSLAALALGTSGVALVAWQVTRGR